MSNNQRRPILYKGEVYSSSIEKTRSMRQKPPTMSYEESRIKILKDIELVNKKLQEVPPNLKLPNESIICVRVQKEYVAKTFYPEALFGGSNDLQEIGSRMWKEAAIPLKVAVPQKEYGRMYFVRATDQGIKGLEKKLNQKESTLFENFKLDIRKISTLDLLSDNEQVLGFDNEWSNGRVEAILHPFYLDRSLALSHFKQLIGSVDGDVNSINVKQYDEDGLTFVSFNGDKNILKILRGYNPLRTIHPLTFRNIPDITRGTVQPGSPIPPTFTKKSLIIAGVIDGGYITGNPCLDQYVEIVHSVPGAPLEKFQSHGTSVTSAALYGPLHGYSNKDVLFEPSISIRNFRVLSKETKDPDLYCVIDAIEDIVPKNTDIQCYNISIGPQGPILDDPISRFTYACDILSKKYNVLFHVAVGNEGEKPIDYNRIQSPADIVNGLAIGAHTLDIGKIVAANYSCEGPGREGNKMKPDVTALGGCDKFPLQLIAPIPNHRTYINGTSFASPQSLALSAKLIGGSKGVINPLTARLLTIHSANGNNTNDHCNKMGHGTLPDDVDEVMSCIDKSYTLIYEGELQNGNYRQYSVPWIDEFEKGSVNLRWTLAVLSSVDANSPEDYTSSSVEIGFYPNSSKYTFSIEEGGKNKTQHVDIEKEPQRVKDLLAAGWKKSNTPKSATSPKPFASENQLRRDYLKWDTVDVRQLSMNIKSLKQPIFHIHAIGRGKRVKDSKVKFAFALTVEVPKGNVDIYQKVRAKYEALLPIRMDVQNIIPVNSINKT